MSQKKTILVVDDEPKIRVLLKDFLEKEDFQVMEAANGKDTLQIFKDKKEEINLILLDVMIPFYDGWTVCREIRKTSEVPIIMLTARSEDLDEAYGLEIGADDYIKKPIMPTTLIARIHALFRRLDKDKSNNKIVFGNLEIDDAFHTVKVNAQLIDLSPKEYNILLLLVENKGRIVSREQLLKSVWGYDYYGGLRTVDTHINRLRIKLGEESSIIHTIRGFGYKFGR